MFCSSCGCVITEGIENTGPEWRSSSLEDYQSKARTGTPSSLAISDMGLSTKMDPADKDATGKSLSGSMKGTISRLRIWDSRSQSRNQAHRNYQKAFNQLRKLKEKLGLGDAVIEKAAYIYRKATERGLSRGRSVSALIASAVYAACRHTDTGRTLKDIALTNNVSTKAMRDSYRDLVLELDLKMPVADPIKCITRIANNANLDEKTMRKSLEILQKAQDNQEASGKDPMGIAAAALYVACVQRGKKKTQKYIAHAAGITEVTLRNRYSSLRTALKL